MNLKTRKLLNHTNTVGVIASMKDLQFASANRTAADILEWRIDCVQNPSIMPSLRFLNRPLILTVRDASERGKEPSWGFERRAWLYRHYLSTAGSIPKLVDIEASTAIALQSTIAHAKREHGAGVIISCHRFDMKSLLSKLDEAAQICHKVGGDVLKLAVEINSLDDFAKFLTYVTRIQRRTSIPIAVMAMGKFGKVSRLFFGMNRTPLVYGYLAEAAATGQWHVSEIKGMIARVSQ